MTTSRTKLEQSRGSGGGRTTIPWTCTEGRLGDSRTAYFWVSGGPPPGARLPPTPPPLPLTIHPQRSCPTGSAMPGQELTFFDVAVPGACPISRPVSMGQCEDNALGWGCSRGAVLLRLQSAPARGLTKCLGVQLGVKRVPYIADQLGVPRSPQARTGTRYSFQQQRRGNGQNTPARKIQEGGKSPWDRSTEY